MLQPTKRINNEAAYFQFDLDKLGFDDPVNYWVFPAYVVKGCFRNRNDRAWIYANINDGIIPLGQNGGSNFCPSFPSFHLHPN